MRVQYTVTGPKRSPDVTFVADIDPAAGTVGAPVPGEAADADLVVTVGRHDLPALAAGDVRQDVLFMQGRLKVAGSMGRYMDLIPLAGGEAYRGLLAALAGAAPA
jgi:hypothetical protein